MFRLSLVGWDSKTRRLRVNRLVHRLREAGFDWEHWGVVEANPRGTGHHFHGLQRGSYVDQGLLQRFCEREGMGIPWISEYRREGRGGATYALKGAGYALKGGAELLDLNGGRYGQWTRGFFEGGYRAAVARAIAAHYGR
jgi:hypothetical protein